MTKHRNTEIGLIVSKIRIKHNLSQTELAKRLKISKNTLQNWEAGITSPSISDAYNIFKELGENPIIYIKELVYEAASSDISDEEKRLAHYNIDCMTDIEVQIFNYLMSGLHGSSPYAMWQEIGANLSCTIGSKHTVATVIANNYTNETMLGLVQTHVKPDMIGFQDAIKAGQEAYVSGRKGYHKL